MDRHIYSVKGSICVARNIESTIKLQDEATHCTAARHQLISPGEQHGLHLSTSLQGDSILLSIFRHRGEETITVVRELACRARRERSLHALSPAAIAFTSTVCNKLPYVCIDAFDLIRFAISVK